MVRDIIIYLKYIELRVGYIKNSNKNELKEKLSETVIIIRSLVIVLIEVRVRGFVKQVRCSFFPIKGECQLHFPEAHHQRIRTLVKKGMES